MWARAEGEHRGLPTFTGNDIEKFEGLVACYIEDYIYDPPTSLEPDKDHDGDFRREYYAGVHLEFSSSNHIHALNLRKKVAKELYTELHLLFGEHGD